MSRTFDEGEILREKYAIKPHCNSIIQFYCRHFSDVCYFYMFSVFYNVFIVFYDVFIVNVPFPHMGVSK
jgi:hypothetical protein